MRLCGKIEWKIPLRVNPTIRIRHPDHASSGCVITQKAESAYGPNRPLCRRLTRVNDAQGGVGRLDANVLFPITGARGPINAMSNEKLCLFALGASRKFGASVARHLGIALSDHEETDFEDGEHKARPLHDARGSDVFVVHSLYADAHQSIGDKLCRLLFFLSTLRDASPARLTAVIPYLCYARQDSRSHAQDPVTTRYMARMIEASGADQVMTLEVHNLAAFQNAFRCRTDHLDSGTLFAHYFETLRTIPAITVISPDFGGVKRAEKFRELLGNRLGRSIGFGFMEKHRTKEGMAGGRLAAEVRGHSVIIFDDMISSGKTMARAAQACRDAGAAHVYGAAAHGLFVGEAATLVSSGVLDQVVITNTVPPWRLDPQWVRDEITVLDATHLIASAIARIHGGDS